jgi:hypothetical protein
MELVLEMIEILHRIVHRTARVVHPAVGRNEVRSRPPPTEERVVPRILQVLFGKSSSAGQYRQGQPDGHSRGKRHHIRGSTCTKTIADSSQRHPILRVEHGGRHQRIYFFLDPSDGDDVTMAARSLKTGLMPCSVSVAVSLRNQGEQNAPILSVSTRCRFPTPEFLFLKA